MNFMTSNLTPRVGTEIKTTRDVLLGASLAGTIRELLEQRGVLVFRGLHFDDEEQIAFTKTLGTLLPIVGDVLKISVDEEETETADLNRGAVCWHFDGTTDDLPSRAGLLSPRRLSKEGGQTEFANTYAAYDDLPESEKRAIEKVKIVHSQESIQKRVFPNPTEAQRERWRSFKAKAHPLVWAHKSGRKSLALGTTATSVVGMREEDGRALIDRLLTWMTRPQYVYRHEWEMGDLVIWDNTGVVHRVIPYPLDSRRMLHRTTLEGEESLV